MSIDKDVLKRLRALYVEDDDNIRNELSSLLSNFLERFLLQKMEKMELNNMSKIVVRLM